jgi:glycosyltransferase involved in cell wall biosynthesis
MRALFLSDLETRGGAAIAASRIATGLSDLGVGVERLVGLAANDPYFERAPWTTTYAGLPRGLEIAVNGLRRGAPVLAREAARPIAAHFLAREVARRSFDILHVHAIHNSPWSHAALGALDPDLPTVWTFHDHWSFSPESYLFRDGTGAEVRLKPDGADRAKAQTARDRYFASRRRLALVANSDDTARYATERLHVPVRTIHYGLPLDLYSPSPKIQARAALRLPANELLIGFSSDSNSDPVKGFDVLERALRESGVEAFAVAVGTAKPRDFKAGEVAVRALGRVDNPLFQSLVYSACDLFVVPSRAEALGQVAMESIACGTPVIASEVGGLPDVVLPGRSGWLFPPGDSQKLAELLRRLAQDRTEIAAVAQHCRELAETRWSLARQARDYLTLYQSL